jgi:nicotinate dehydrogenase subunit A
VDGQAIRSCVFPISALGTRKVTTLEGLASGGQLSALQQAFIDEQAVQCGYCINGMVMQAADLLKRTPKPTVQQIREGLAMNLCRCGTHQRIVRAVQRASGQPVTV